MTYHLNLELRNIISPIIVREDNREWKFRDGVELVEYSFEEPYVVESIKAVGDQIVISVAVAESASGLLNYTGEEPGSFF